MVDPHGLELILEYFPEKYGNLSFYIQENGQSVVSFHVQKLLLTTQILVLI
jgi:beta-glucosidase/6-phospho-beta-glucosidase/beta-galactosidase